MSKKELTESCFRPTSLQSRRREWPSFGLGACAYSRLFSPISAHICPPFSNCTHHSSTSFLPNAKDQFHHTLRPHTSSNARTLQLASGAHGPLGASLLFHNWGSSVSFRDTANRLNPGEMSIRRLTLPRFGD